MTEAEITKAIDVFENADLLRHAEMFFPDADVDLKTRWAEAYRAWSLGYLRELQLGTDYGTAARINREKYRAYLELHAACLNTIEGLSASVVDIQIP